MIRQLNQRQLLALLVILSAFTLFACGPAETIQVVITPTPDPDAPTVTPTITPQPPTATPTQAETATESQTATPQPTETPTPLPATTETPPDDLTPSATFLGPVVQPDYRFVPPPTNTPEPIPTITRTPVNPLSPPDEPTAGPSPTPVTGFDPALMGLQVDTNFTFDDWMRVIGAAETTGVEWIKVQVNWAFLQPDGPNEFNAQMQLFERQMEALARPGFNILLSVAKAPDWARTDLTEDGPPDDPQDLADFLTFMLAETKIGEVTSAVEVWNEPNLAREWRGTLPFNGAGYMQLFRPSYDAIRAFSSTVDIVTAGLAPTSNLGQAVDDLDFLQQMYNAGLGDYQDIAIGVHPYGWGNPPDARCCGAAGGPGWDEDPQFFFIETLERTYAIMQANGHEDLQMWPTEFGWSSWEGFPSPAPEAWHTYTSPQEQAQHMLRAFEIGQDLPYVGPMFLWNLNFASEATIDQEIAGFSILNPVLFPQERPAYWALAQATGALQPTPTPSPTEDD